MKRSKLIALAAAAAVTLSAFPLLVHGDTATYDPESDPLVSLSYIDQVLTPAIDKKIADMSIVIEKKLEEKNKGIDEQLKLCTDAINSLKEKLDVLEQENTALRTEMQTLQDANSVLSQRVEENQYKVEFLPKGTKLLAESSCEIILRTGSAIVVSITINGINDISTGEELMNAESVPLYHSLLVPRGGDGRGIQITSNDAYVMVRGAYTIVQ